MKKIVLLSLVVAALGSSASAFAQAAGPVGAPPQSGAAKSQGKIDRKEMQKINEEILAKLNLTDEQKAKIKAHEEEMKKKLLELRKGNKGAAKSEDAKEKLKALRKENQEFMKQTLTKDQMREMQKLRRDEIKALRDKKEAPAKP